MLINYVRYPNNEMVIGKSEVYIRAKVSIRPLLISGFRSMNRLEVLLLTPGWDANRRVTPRVKFAVTHLYTWMERDTVRVKCLAQEHNTVSQARGPFLESPGKFSGP